MGISQGGTKSEEHVGPFAVGAVALPSCSLASTEEGNLTADELADLLAELVEAVNESDTLLLLDRSPPDETRSPSITVGAEKGEEKPRLSVTFRPDNGQVEFRGVYWRSGQFTPDMRERHGLLFPSAAFRLEEDGYRLGDPRPEAPGGEGEEVASYPRAREAAGALLELLEHFYGMVDERSD